MNNDQHILSAIKVQDGQVVISLPVQSPNGGEVLNLRQLAEQMLAATSDRAFLLQRLNAIKQAAQSDKRPIAQPTTTDEPIYRIQLEFDYNDLHLAKEGGALREQGDELNNYRLVKQVPESRVVEVLDRYAEWVEWWLVSREPYARLFDNTFLKRHRHRLDWKFLSRNTNLVWTTRLIEGLEDLLDWKFVTSLLTDLTIEDVKRHADKINFADSKQAPTEQFDPRSNAKLPAILSLSAITRIIFTTQILDYFLKHWNWTLLSGNRSLHWSYDLVERYEGYWDWKSLSENPSLPWSYELINRFAARWNWVNISKNNGIYWTLDLLHFLPKIHALSVCRYAGFAPEFLNAIAVQLDEAYFVERKYFHYKPCHDCESELTIDEVWKCGWDWLCDNPLARLSAQQVLDYATVANTHPKARNPKRLTLTTSLAKFFPVTEQTLTIIQEGFCNFGYPEGTIVPYIIYWMREVLNSDDFCLDLDALRRNEWTWGQAICSPDFVAPAIWQKVLRPFVVEYHPDLLSLIEQKL